MPKYSIKHKAAFPKQRGATLLELMVGITIGLLTVTVALGALMISRSASSTVSEASQLQQQASFAFRVISQQIRQAGGRQLDPTTTADVHAKFYEPVAGVPVDFTGITPIKGNDSPDATEFSLETSYQNVKEITVAKAAGEYQIRNCLQESTSNAMVTSQFKLDAVKKELKCKGSTEEAIIQNATDFKVRYLTQATDGSYVTAPTYQYTDADAAKANWLKIYAVEICLELEGTEKIDSAGATYKKCDGTVVDRGNRLRMVFRNTYHIRNHAWPSAT